MFYRKFIHKNMKFIDSQPRHCFFRRNNSPYVSFCRADTLRNGSFFHIYACDSLIFFRTFFRIDNSDAIHCILQLAVISHISRSPLSLRNHKAYTFLYGKFRGKDVSNRVLFFGRIFFHKSGVPNRVHILGS